VFILTSLIQTQVTTFAIFLVYDDASLNTPGPSPKPSASTTQSSPSNKPSPFPFPPIITESSPVQSLEHLDVTHLLTIDEHPLKFVDDYE